MCPLYGGDRAHGADACLAGRSAAVQAPCGDAAPVCTLRGNLPARQCACLSASCVVTAELGVTCAAVLLCTAPVFGRVLARLLYAEHMTPQKIVACALNFVDVVLVVSGGDPSLLCGRWALACGSGG